jgi:hypothetical protein
MSKITYVLLALTLGLAGCGSTGSTLTVTGKEYVYVRLQPEWLAPCDQPRNPITKGGIPTNEELMLYVTDLIGAVEKCNLKVSSINKAYTKFLIEVKSASAIKAVTPKPPPQ